MVAALGILCEGIFRGSCASSSMWALSSAQLLLCWSHFPCGIMSGGWYPSSVTPVLQGRGSEDRRRAALWPCVQGEGTVQRWKFVPPVFDTCFSEVLGVDAKAQSSDKQCLIYSGCSDFHFLSAVLIGLVLLTLTSLGKVLETIKSNSTCHKKKKINNDLSAGSTAITCTHLSSLMVENPTARYRDCI